MELIDEITSLVDNELKDFLIANRLKKLIHEDKNLRREYLIQKSIKNLLISRLACSKPPSCLCRRLKSKLDNEIKNSAPNKKI
jgi:hypothetical protein